MNPLTLMEMKKESFTKNDQKIYQAIQDDPEIVSRYNIVDFSKYCKVSQPSITRFAQKLGFEKYTDFKFEMYKYARMKTNTTQYPANKTKVPAIQNYKQLLDDMDDVLSVDMIQKISPYFLKAKHIFLCGVQQSFLPAKQLEFNLQKFGFYAYAMDLNHINSIPFIAKDDDLIVFFSVRANNIQLQELINEHKDKQKGKILLITMNGNHNFKDKVVDTVCLPPAVRKDYSLRLESQVVFMIFVDVLSSFIASEIS